MVHFDHITIYSAANETRLMMETDFFDMSLSQSVPVSGSSFAVFASAGTMELNVSGFIDAAAACVYQTESDYFTFRGVGAKMLFSKTIAFEEELQCLKTELHKVFWCQRAHVIAWSLW